MQDFDIVSGDWPLEIWNLYHVNVYNDENITVSFLFPNDDNLWIVAMCMLQAETHVG